MNDKFCHCGKLLHYTDKEVKTAIEELIKLKGTHIICVNSEKRQFKVPRHYIALHGLKEQDLPKLGFEEVKEICFPKT